MRLLPRLLCCSVALALAVATWPTVARAEGGPVDVAYLFAADADGDGDIYTVGENGQLSNLTANNEPDWDPRLAPTGAGYAFVSRRDGNSEIFVAPLKGDWSVNVTENA
ncbi:MAG: TolB family protein, partial [Anaerolineae bacterium]